MASDPFQFTVEDTLKPLIAALEGLSERRINSIVASTLTAAANEGQKAFREQAQARFDRPKPFTVNGTFVSRATAQSLVATVGFREYAGKGIAAGKYLQAEIHGGSRASKRHEVALQRIGALPPGWQVTPGPSARLDAFGNQAQGEIVRILSALSALSETGFQGNRTTRSTKRKGGKLVRYFVVKPNDPSTRLGPGVYQYEGEGHGRRILKVMNFVPSPKYSIRFPMEQIIDSVLKNKFVDLFIHYATQSIERLKAQRGA